MSLDRELVAAALPTYEIGGELGRGAHGVVLAGTHRTLERPVAIKQLPRGLGSEPEVKQRFITEARTLASFDHPNIVPIYDFVERDGVCLLVMERLTGGTLWDRMQHARLDAGFASGVVLAACAGLEYAHSRGVLHRDVKPENLMFNAAGVLKLTDFGIAKVIGGLTLQTQAGYALGTPAYMGPEQAQGIALTPAADVYSLGTVLYELLAGALPYSANSDPVAALYQHVHTDPTPLSEKAPELEPRLAAVVDRALARDLDDRYASAAEFAADLDAAAREAWGDDWAERAGAGPVGPVVAATPRATKTTTDTEQPKPSRTGRFAAVALGVVLVLGALAFVLTRGDNASSGTGAGFSVDRRSGPIGTQLTVTSTRPCPEFPAQSAPPHVVYVTLNDPRTVAAGGNGDVFGQQFAMNDDRNWVAQFNVPAETTTGETSIRASCFAQEEGFDFPGPYYDYPVGVAFSVTGG